MTSSASCKQAVIVYKDGRFVNRPYNEASNNLVEVDLPGDPRKQTNKYSFAINLFLFAKWIIIHKDNTKSNETNLI